MAGPNFSTGREGPKDDENFTSAVRLIYDSVGDKNIPWPKFLKMYVKAAAKAPLQVKLATLGLFYYLSGL